MKIKKKSVLRIVAAILTVASILIFAPWQAAVFYVLPLPETISEQLDDATTKGGMDGIIVYIQKKGHQPEFYASGWKNKENKIPADPRALFKIASISKLYVAAAVTKLVNDQTLSLDQTLDHYLPSLAKRLEYADQVTLRMLVQHRSGIPNSTDDPEFKWLEPSSAGADPLKFIMDQPALFKPGSQYRYSNTNYMLLGMILDDTLGYSHRDYIKNEILVPLGLHRTFGLQSDVNMEELVSGYHRKYDGDFKSLNFTGASGSMVATAEDVGIFLRALNDGSLFNNAEQEIYSSIYAYEHTGWLPGYLSIARYHKDIDTVVVQFVNTSGGKSWEITEIVYKRIVRILRKRENSL
jgi:D-alanyl-D-alanine carboxypeptidase